ncbi:MAG: type II toxin-antitoxin system RelE/ParE family toxin [Verrucomicrobiota bacterium]
MITSFKDDETRRLHETGSSRRFSAIARVALRKLIQLDAAGEISDLRVPPGNRLEALQGNLAGRHSIRINDQWRLCFRWDGSDASEVEICDYH